MGQFATYELWLLDWSGAQIAYLAGKDLVSFTWQLRLNEPGTYRYEVVAETGKQDLFKIDYILKLMRDYGAGLYEEFVGIHLNSEEWLTQNDEHYWASYGLGPEWVLDQPLLQPLPTPNPDFPRYETWWMHGPADDVMKQMVNESMGSAAALPRQFSYLAIEGNRGEGAVSCYDGRYIRLLEALQSIAAERGETDFRVVRLPAGGFEFRTYCPQYGTERRRGHCAIPTVFSLELQNVGEPKRGIKRSTEVTVAIGGWEGSEQDQELFERLNATALAESPYRRREQYYDMSNVVQSDVIIGMLDQYLIDDGKKEEVQFTPLQTDACLYGRDWNLGDLVTLDLWGYEYDMRITEVNGRISGENEEEIVAVAELMWEGDIITLPPSYTPPPIPPAPVALSGGILAWPDYVMRRSNDDGQTWYDTTASLVRADRIVEVGGGVFVFCTMGVAGAEWWRTVDSGLNWALADSAPGYVTAYDMILAANGNVVAATYDLAGSDVWLSIDGGQNYAFTQAIGGGGHWEIYCFARGATNRIYAAIFNDWGHIDAGEIWYSDDHGVSWLKLCDVANNDIFDMAITDTGTICVLGDLGYGYSTDNGTTWNWTAGNFRILYRMASGLILRGQNGGDIYSSMDGIAWLLWSSAPIDPYIVAESPSGAFLVSDADTIYRLEGGAWTLVFDIAGAHSLQSLRVEGGPLWE